MTFKNTMAKLAIGSLDDPGISVEAHYNPKELAATVPRRLEQQEPSKTGFDIQYDGAQPRTMELEMLFDVYERARPQACRISSTRSRSSPARAIRIRRPQTSCALTTVS